jgi:hypothetical protein
MLTNNAKTGARNFFTYQKAGKHLPAFFGLKFNLNSHPYKEINKFANISLLLLRTVLFYYLNFFPFEASIDYTCSHHNSQYY